MTTTTTTAANPATTVAPVPGEPTDGAMSGHDGPSPTEAARVGKGEIAACFPLVARPQQECPPLRTRLDRIANAARTAVAATDRPTTVHEAGRALAGAALIARDCHQSDLARRISARHIALYTGLPRPLTVQEARQVLGAATSLARTHLHTGASPDLGVAMLARILEAVRARLPITLEGVPRPLPFGDVDSTLREHRTLVALAQAQLVVGATSALARAGRWADATDLVRTHGGIGDRLVEGRQALIISRLLDRDGNGARALVASSDTSQGPDRDVVTCLTALCAPTATRHDAAGVMVDRFRTTTRLGEGYAYYRAKYGATVAVIASAHRHPAAAGVAAQAAVEALQSGDGYAAQEALRHPVITEAISGDVRSGLDQVVKAAGLARNALTGRLPHRLEDAVDLAAHALRPDL